MAVCVEVDALVTSGWSLLGKLPSICASGAYKAGNASSRTWNASNLSQIYKHLKAYSLFSFSYLLNTCAGHPKM